jgi:hypothetical protein
MIAKILFRRLFGTCLSALMLTAGAAGAHGQTFSGGLPADWTCVGNCDTTSADGVVGLATGGGSQVGYVSTAFGVLGASPFALGHEFTGSRLTSSIFAASAGDQLAYQFNYVTSDGNEFADYAWARLVEAGSGSTAAMLFFARTQPADVIAPGGDLPPIDALLTPPSAWIADPSTKWSPLSLDSGDCWGAGCGSSGWVHSDFTFVEGGNYRLEFGTVNWNDDAYHSGMAFDGALTAANNNITAAVPEPQTWALMLAGLAVMLFMGRRKKRDRGLG